jgi:hypothetical protein
LPIFYCPLPIIYGLFLVCCINNNPFEGDCGLFNTKNMDFMGFKKFSF